MDNTREKLIELIGRVQDEGREYTEVVLSMPVPNELLADYLIANGVTINPCKVGNVIDELGYKLGIVQRIR